MRKPTAYGPGLNSPHRGRCCAFAGPTYPDTARVSASKRSIVVRMRPEGMVDRRLMTRAGVRRPREFYLLRARHTCTPRAKRYVRCARRTRRSVHSREAAVLGRRQASPSAEGAREVTLVVEPGLQRDDAEGTLGALDRRR